MHWPGNAVKSKVLDEILADPRGSIVIFDYGCGDGGDWQLVLSQNRHRIKWFGFEPSRTRAARCEERLGDLDEVRVFSREEDWPQFTADYIVSFSVFEHVVDKIAYLKTARDRLSKDGVFYLAYDDGHFRNLLDLNSPTSWLRTLREWVHWHLAPFLVLIGLESNFKRPVSFRRLLGLIAQCDFEIASMEYGNLTSLKLLQRDVPSAGRAEFVRIWRECESQLNEAFGREVTHGERPFLWQQMSTHLLKLKLRAPADGGVT